MDQTSAGNAKAAGAAHDVVAQPGRFPIKVKVTMSKTPGQKGTFVHDATLIDDLSESVTAHLHPHEERLNNVAEEYDQFAIRVRRMFYMGTAKKLSVSLSDDDDPVIAGYLKSVASAQINLPSPVVQLLDNFGCINEKDMEFKMLGQPLIAFSYFGRACYPEDLLGGVDRFQALFVNTRWPGYKRMVFDYAVSQINAWAHSSGQHDFIFAGNAVRMSVPTAAAGLAVYRQLVVDVPKDAWIVRMLNIAVIIEDVLNAEMTQQVRVALRAEAMLLEDWTKDDISALIKSYLITIDARLSVVFGAKTNWVPVMVMKASGSRVQLLRQTTDHMLHSYFDLSGQGLELGWMFAGSKNFVVPNPQAFHLVVPQPKYVGINDFVKGMMKQNY